MNTYHSRPLGARLDLDRHNSPQTIKAIHPYTHLEVYL